MSRKAHSFCPSVDGLEDRVFLSIATPYVRSGVLNIVGDNTGDNLRVSRSGNKLAVQDFRGNKTFWFDLSYYKIRRIDIWGQGGNDQIHNNTYFASRIYGGDGNDTLLGGYVNDLIMGGNGNDYITGGYGNDSLSGGAGNDTFYGHGGNDVISGDAGNDWIFAGDGNDSMWGGTGRDVLHGSYGVDLFVVSDDNDADAVYDYRSERSVVYARRNDFVSMS